MQLTDAQLAFYDTKVLKIAKEKRKEFLRQVDYLIGRLQAKIDADTSFWVNRFRKTGSLMKGTVLQPKGGYQADVDVAVELDIRESEKADLDRMHRVLRRLLIAVYPQKKEEDFEVQPRTLGIEFMDSGLCVDLVPIVPIASEPSYAWQPSSRDEPAVKTSIDGQLEFIRARRELDERFRPIVRILKAWKRFQELAISSFAIELLVAHLLDERGPAATLEDGVVRFFLYVAQSGLQERIAFAENGAVGGWPSDPVVILDPVNAENNVTRRVTTGERAATVAKTLQAWECLSTARLQRGNYRALATGFWPQLQDRRTMSTYSHTFAVTHTYTYTRTYTRADIRRVINEIAADLDMIAESSGVLTRDEVNDYVADLVAFAQEEYLWRSTSAFAIASALRFAPRDTASPGRHRAGRRSCLGTICGRALLVARSKSACATRKNIGSSL
jgi:hypothetical protein